MYLFSPEKYVACFDLVNIAVVNRYTNDNPGRKPTSEEHDYHLDIYVTKCKKGHKSKGARVFRFSFPLRCKSNPPYLKLR